MRQNYAATIMISFDGLWSIPLSEIFSVLENGELYCICVFADGAILVQPVLVRLRLCDYTVVSVLSILEQFRNAALLELPELSNRSALTAPDYSRTDCSDPTGYTPHCLVHSKQAVEFSCVDKQDRYNY